MSNAGLLERTAARLDRAAFLFGKRLRARRNGLPRLLIVAGVQRSGTNMLMDVLEASPATEVFHEIDPRLYQEFLMGPDETVAALRARTAFPHMVIKALHEPERTPALMDRFAPAQLIWVFRRWDDVVNSNMRSWPGGRNRIDDIVREPALGKWRTRALSAETLAELRAVYREGLSDASAQAIFYYYRNKLFFELGLVDDPRVLALDYDRLLSEPGIELDRVARFTGITITPRMRAIPDAGAVRRKPPPEIDPAIEALCARIYARLVEAAGHTPEQVRI